MSDRDVTAEWKRLSEVREQNVAWRSLAPLRYRRTKGENALAVRWRLYCGNSAVLNISRSKERPSNRMPLK
jgi:hypothetical protein